MRNQAYTNVEIMAVLTSVVLLSVVLYPVFQRDNRGYHRPSCQSPLKQIGLAFAQYKQDYNEKFPPVSSKQGGWVDLLQPYVKSTHVFHCPDDGAGFIAGTTDYFYNSRLAGIDEGKLSFISNTVMSGDGLSNLGPDANLASFPPQWLDDANSPAHRHLGGANYLHADGHVKWYLPEKLTNKSLPLPSDKPTFAIK